MKTLTATYLLWASLLATNAQMVINPYQFATGGGASFTYYSTVFDGANDYMVTSTGLASVTSNAFTMSFWAKTTATSGRFIMNQAGFGNGGFYIASGTGPTIQFVAGGSSGNVHAILETPVASDWTHYLFAGEYGGSVYLYTNGVSESSTAWYAGRYINWPGTANAFSIGAETDGGVRWAGTMSEFYLHNEFIDPTVEANRQKFISAEGKPVDLGADGSTPTGTQPLVYLPNPYNTFHENEGGGGDFTVTGALGDGGADIP